MVWQSAATGCVFLVLAHVVAKHHPSIKSINWDWVHSGLMLLAGVGMMRLLAGGMYWLIHLIQRGILWLAGKVDRWPGWISWVSAMMRAFAVAMPWCIGAFVVVTVVFHMLPRVGKGIHNHTATLAYFAPASILIFPPLFTLVGG